MDIYKKMYSLVCSEMSKAIDALPKTEENQKGLKIMQDALYAAEEMYVSSEEEEE